MDLLYLLKVFLPIMSTLIVTFVAVVGTLAYHGVRIYLLLKKQ